MIIVLCTSCGQDRDRRDMLLMEFSDESRKGEKVISYCTGYTPICRFCVDDLECRTAELLEQL